MSEMKVVLKAEAGSTLTAIGQVQAAADATAKSFNDATRAAAMSSKAAAGSLVDLRQKLAQARGELEKMTEGSDGFAEQASQVKALATQYDALKKNISEATAVSAGLDDDALRKQAEAARVAAGSVQKLKEQLADAETELNRLEVGSDAFKEQAAVVKSLSGQYESAKTAIKELTTENKAASQAVSVAANSYKALRDELAKAESALEGMEVGSEQFKQQANVVKALASQVANAKSQMNELTTETKEVAQVASAAAGSYQALREELKKAESALEGMAVGSEEFKRQAATVKDLAKQVALAKNEMDSLTTESKEKVKAVAGSFSALNEELTENIRKLREMKSGTAEFDEQKRKVQELEAAVKKETSALQTGARAAKGSVDALTKELKEQEDILNRMAVGSSGFDAQRRKVVALKKEVDNANKAINATPTEPLKEVAVGFGIATAAAVALYAALKKVKDAQDEIVKGGADTATEIDTLARRLQIQAGLTDNQREQQTTAVIQQSSDAGVTADVGFRAATQLAGSGFADAVDKGTLKTVLDTIQASSFQGSPEELVSAFTESLNAYGLEKTNENLQNIAIAAQGLFKQTDFQLTELADFAKNAAVFKNANITPTQSLAGFTALREVLPAAESGTGLRNFVTILQGAAGDKSNTEALGKLGLTPDQVDLVGESLDDVIARLKAASDKVPEEQRNLALGNLFGRENVASASLLIASGDRVKELQNLQANKEQFEKDRAVAAESIQAKRNRIANDELIANTKVAAQLADLDLDRRSRGQRLREFREQSAATGNPVVGAAAAGSSAVLDTASGATGTDFTNNAISEGLFQVLSNTIFARPKAFGGDERKAERVVPAPQAQVAAPMINDANGAAALEAVQAGADALGNGGFDRAAEAIKKIKKDNAAEIGPQAAIKVPSADEIGKAVAGANSEIDSKLVASLDALAAVLSEMRPQRQPSRPPVPLAPVGGLIS